MQQLNGLEQIDHERRLMLRTTAAVFAAVSAASVFPAYATFATTNDELRPFRITVPEEALADLRRRISTTKWPERETVEDPSQGVQLATISELARYWASDYD